jgi:hypothetical protein
MFQASGSSLAQSKGDDMRIIISRMTDRGWPTVGMSDRTVRSVASERVAMNLARDFAGGRSYRIEFFHDNEFYKEPYKTIEQAALNFGVDSRGDSC